MQGRASVGHMHFDSAAVAASSLTLRASELVVVLLSTVGAVQGRASVGHLHVDSAAVAASSLTRVSK